MDKPNKIEDNENQTGYFQMDDIVMNIKSLTEEMLFDMSMQEWIMQIHLLQAQGYSSAWVEIENHLAGICTQNNIRYIYFDVITERVKMKYMYSVKVNLEKMDFDTMTQILVDFAQANLNYMDYMYMDAVFDNDKELLIQEEKASLWIANGLSMDNSQWREKLQCYGEAAKICPILGDFVKRYMKLFGEQLVK